LIGLDLQMVLCHETVDKTGIRFCSTQARNEASLLVREARLRLAMFNLSTALRTGKATCLGGFVDVASVRVDHVVRARDDLVSLHASAPDVEMLAQVSLAVCRARTALLEGSWELVRHALESVGIDCEIAPGYSEYGGGQRVSSGVTGRSVSAAEVDLLISRGDRVDAHTGGGGEVSGAVLSDGGKESSSEAKETSSSSSRSSNKDGPVQVHEGAWRELHELRLEVVMHERIRQVLKDLRNASVKRDSIALQRALATVDGLRLEDCPDLGVVDRVKRARSLLAHIAYTETRLASALASPSVRELDEVRCWFVCA
jgi:hypothetical protein